MASTADNGQVGGDHYKQMPMQPWTVMQMVLTDEEFIGYLKGNIIKYAMRAGHKPDSDDGGKAEHYRQKLLEVIGTEGNL
jgi:hypothetical protein